MSADERPQRRRTFTWSEPEVVAGASRKLSGRPLAEAWAAGDVPRPPICALMNFRLPRGVGWTSLDLDVTFVRAMTKDTGPIRCKARLVHRGARVMTAEARLSDGQGRRYAHGAATCLGLGNGGWRAPSDNA